MAAIENQEQLWIEKTQTRDRQALVILGLIFVIFAYTNWRVMKSFWRHNKDLPLPKINQSGTLWEPPTNIDPAQVEQLISAREGVSPKAFTATLLSLVQAKVFRLLRSDQKQGLIIKQYKYYLEAIRENSSINKLSSIQMLVMSIIDQAREKKKEIGGKDRLVIPLTSLVNFFKQRPTYGRAFFLEIFPKQVLEENLTEGYFEPESADAKQKNKLGLGVVMNIFFVIGFGLLLSVAGHNNWNMTLIVSLLLLILAVLAIFFGAIMQTNYLKRTEAGRQEAAGWLAFKKHIENYKTTAEYPIDSIILWEKYLVYGTALGISARALAALPISIPANQNAALAGQWGGIISANEGTGTFNFDVNSLTSALSGLGQITSQSYGASGAGSSGGASGGGGEGGGGGGGGAG